MTMDEDLKYIMKPQVSNGQTSYDVAIGEQSLTRKFSLWSMLALAFSVLGTWSTFAQDLASGLTTGGPVAILWGLCLVTFCNICVAVSLGELCSSMPTALGQSYWVARLWNTPRGRFASYLCASINTFGCNAARLKHVFMVLYFCRVDPTTLVSGFTAHADLQPTGSRWTLTASQIAFMTNFILSMKVMFNPSWSDASTGWIEFLVFLGITLLFTVVNLVSCRKDSVLPRFNNFVGICFGGLFLVFSLALLTSVGTRSGLQYQPASFALAGWINNTGWSDGVVWFTGLVQAAYGLTAFDSVIHMVEEIPQPSKNAPKAIYLSVICGAASGFIFMVVCLFCIQDVSHVINSPTGLPFMQLIEDAVGLNGGATLLALFIFNGLGQGVSVATTASRMTWGFARDGGIPWSQYFAHVDATWKVPARALWLQGLIIASLGILYLFANTVLTAILSVSTIALTVSYGMPILALLVVGRDKLPPGEFSLGRLGPVINWISVVYCCVTTVFFFFPGSPSPAPSDMNYAIAVFGIMLVVAVAFWILNGSLTYLKTNDAEQRLANAMKAEENAAMHISQEGLV